MSFIKVSQPVLMCAHVIVGHSPVTNHRQTAGEFFKCLLNSSVDKGAVGEGKVFYLVVKVKSSTGLE